MTDEERLPRPASEIPEWELEEMIREVIKTNFQPAIAHAAIVWLDERIAVYNLARARPH
jgi:hypothetical protein